MGKSSSYSDKLKDPRWQKKRLQILERDKWTCVACGSKDNTLHVHHKIYNNIEPWEYEDYKLATLCEDCHAMIHEIKGGDLDTIGYIIQLALNNLAHSVASGHLNVRILAHAQARKAFLDGQCSKDSAKAMHSENLKLVREIHAVFLEGIAKNSQFSDRESILKLLCSMMEL